MTKPQAGDIIKFLSNYQEDQYYLVLSASKKEKTLLGNIFAKCDLLNLERGSISKYDVYYKMEHWIKVA